MDNLLETASIVSGIGMLVLFVALTLLYGLMLLMTTLFKERAEEPPGVAVDGGGKRRRAAAIAVLLARAEAERGALATPGSEESPWLHYHRQRGLEHGLWKRKGR